MSLSAKQTAELEKPLDKSKVAERTQSGRKLSYIEGWHAIAEANRIFGFDGWQRETVEMREVRPPELVKNPQSGKETWRVGFIAKVRITVGDIVREGTGFGSGALPELGEAYESAVKEAETDAMKRALMTFGNPFGLALYDKKQTDVVDAGAEKAKTDAAKVVEKHTAAIGSANSKDALRKAWDAALADKKAGLIPDPKQQAALVSERNAAIKRIETAEAGDQFPGDIPLGSSDPTAQFDRMERA